MIADEMMSHAAALLAEGINKSLPAPCECTHDYSTGFERKMKRLMRKVDHPVRHRVLRAATSILLIIFIGFGAVLSISAEAREIVFGWVRQQCGSFYDYFFVGENRNATQAKYYPNWIPDDCTFLASYETSGGEEFIYSDDEGMLVQYAYISNPSNESLHIDGVEYEKHKIRINNYTGEIGIATVSTETNYIVWIDTDQNILFYISGKYDEDTLLKMATNFLKSN